MDSVTHKTILLPSLTLSKLISGYIYVDKTLKTVT